MFLDIFLIIIYIANAYAVSTDCPNMINLDQGLLLNTQQQAIWTQVNVDCCNATGVICVDQRVTQINWSSRNLNGSINATALSDGLQSLVQLTGSIQSTWPSGLQSLYLYSNQLTGSISSTWPSGLLVLALVIFHRFNEFVD